MLNLRSFGQYRAKITASLIADFAHLPPPNFPILKVFLPKRFFEVDDFRYDKKF